MDRASGKAVGGSVGGVYVWAFRRLEKKMMRFAGGRGCNLVSNGCLFSFCGSGDESASSGVESGTRVNYVLFVRKRSNLVPGDRGRASVPVCQCRDISPNALVDQKPACL